LRIVPVSRTSPPRLRHYRGDTDFMDIQAQIEFSFHGVFAGSNCHKLNVSGDPLVPAVGAALFLQEE
jgi:hypothetical protein